MCQERERLHPVSGFRRQYTTFFTYWCQVCVLADYNCWWGQAVLPSVWARGKCGSCVFRPHCQVLLPVAHSVATWGWWVGLLTQGHDGACCNSWPCNCGYLLVGQQVCGEWSSSSQGRGSEEGLCFLPSLSGESTCIWSTVRFWFD